MNERQMKKFIFAFLSLDAANISDRPGFMTELRAHLAQEKGLVGYGELTYAEQTRLERAATAASERMDALAGQEGLDMFWGGVDPR